MANKINRKVSYFATKIILSLTVTSVYAAETILQKEEMSFETCLKVIDMSSEKLLISPEIFDEEVDKRTAIFELKDGKLKITCDGVNNYFTVSSF